MLSDAGGLFPRTVLRKRPEGEQRTSVMARNSQGRPADVDPQAASAVGRFFAKAADHVQSGNDWRGRGLPTELGFLAQQGFPVDALFAAVNAAPRGVLPLDTALAAGAVGEDEYYAALARRLGSTAYRGEPGFAAGFDP